VGIAPGPPSNIQPALPDDAGAVNALRFDTAAGCPVYSEMSKPVYADLEFIRTYWANSARFPAGNLALYARSVVAESARVLNERFNIGGAGLRIDDAERVARRPILVITGEHDPRHARDVDGAVAAYLQADFIWLADIGIRGNGHMLMIEDNSDEVAGVIVEWMHARNLR
jgi:pimeloyl-ACP methyl ester carboxylesterase